jgi:elongator complex protein 3
MRIMREIPPEFLVAGTTRIDLRKDIELEIKKRKLESKIKEIRFREIGFEMRDKSKKQKINQDLKLKITKYKASQGTEYFLEFVNKNNILFGLCRLRIQKSEKTSIISSIHASAIIRELHVYGQSLAIGEKASKNNSFISQHRGLGKLLMQNAEQIAKKEHIRKIFVISGVGVREYYKKLNYNTDSAYVSKMLNY